MEIKELIILYILELNGLDIPPKKTGKAPPVKRKQGHSLINPGSRK